MCAGAIVESRLKRLVFGCFDVKRGAFGSLINVNTLPLNHKAEVLGGILRDKSKQLLRDFFQQRRGTEVVIPGRLEIGCTPNQRTVGSNPTLSAITIVNIH